MSLHPFHELSDGNKGFKAMGVHQVWFILEIREPVYMKYGRRTVGFGGLPDNSLGMRVDT